MNLLDEGLDEGPALGQLALLQEVFQIPGVGRDSAYIVYVCPSLGENGPGVRRRIPKTLLSLPMFLDSV